MAEEKKSDIELRREELQKERDSFLKAAAEYKKEGNAGASFPKAVDLLITLYSNNTKYNEYENAIIADEFDNKGRKVSDPSKGVNDAKEARKKYIYHELKEQYIDTAANDTEKTARTNQIEEMLSKLEPVPTSFSEGAKGWWDKFLATLYKDGEVKGWGILGFGIGAAAGWGIGKAIAGDENPILGFLLGVICAVAGAFVAAALSAGGGSDSKLSDFEQYSASAAGVNSKQPIQDAAVPKKVDYANLLKNNQVDAAHVKDADLVCNVPVDQVPTVSGLSPKKVDTAFCAV